MFLFLLGTGWWWLCWAPVLQGGGKLPASVGHPAGPPGKGARLGMLMIENKVPAKSAGCTEVIGRKENLFLCSSEQMSNGNTLSQNVSQ